jgi:phosphate transport system protein
MSAALPDIMKKAHLEPSYDVDLAHVRGLIEGMAALVDEMLAASLAALRLRDVVEAKQIAARDREVNALEVEIDECCLKLLARWQPAASDLRFVAATLKLVTDLERVGDHCVNICERLVELHGDHVDCPVDLEALMTAVPALLRDAVLAWRSEDSQMAGQVIERGGRVAVLVREVMRGALETARPDPSSVPAVIRWHEIAGYLERIGAHATNIAEMVVFLVRGKDVRHLGRLPMAAGSQS